jgi:hypothetical protein
MATADGKAPGGVAGTDVVAAAAVDTLLLVPFRIADGGVQRLLLPTLLVEGSAAKSGEERQPGGKGRKCHTHTKGNSAIQDQ